MENTEQKVYPRIWDYSGERKIVGETKLSWIVVRRRQEDAEWVPHVQGLYDDKKSFLFSRLIDWQYLKSRDYVELVNKKALQDSPNQQRPQWFLSEESRADYVFCVQHRSDIGRAVATGNHDAATLRQVADLIGWKAAK